MGKFGSCPGLLATYFIKKILSKKCTFVHGQSTYHIQAVLSAASLTQKTGCIVSKLARDMNRIEQYWSCLVKYDRISTWTNPSSPFDSTCSYSTPFHYFFCFTNLISNLSPYFWTLQHIKIMSQTYQTVVCIRAVYITAPGKCTGLKQW